MHAAIFMWAGLILIGSVSIMKCYVGSSEDDDQIPFGRRRVESDPSSEWYELFQSVRSAKRVLPSESSEDAEEGGSNSKCNVDQLSLAPNKCSCPVGPTTSPCQKQTSGLCAVEAIKYSPPVVSITFGAGSKKYSSATPAQLGFSTSYGQIVDKRLVDGNFAITNEVPADYPTVWLGGGLDHTPKSNGGNAKGYMMVVGVKVGPPPSVLLSIPVNDLHIGMRYQFSVYLANIVKYGQKMILPDIVFEVRTATADSTLLASSSTGKIPEEKTLTWKQYGLSFITPSSSIVVSIISNAPGGRGNDIAIDDISFLACASINSAACD